jgi:DNA-binding NarL/FixJ family response regulator
MRIVVAATDPALRAGLRAQLLAAGAAGVADTADEEALGTHLSAGLADVAVTADRWPDVAPFIRRAWQRGRPIAVLLRHMDTVESHPALRAGAAALLPWDTSPHRLAAALAAVAAGLRVLPALPPRPHAPMLTGPEGRPLSERERQVLEQIASGLPNKEIARRLSVSPNTVKQHVTAIFEKLAVRTRAEAYREAVRRGELTL